jgi:hypothetical protein
MAGTLQRRKDDRVYEAVDANLAAGTVVIASTTASESGLQGIKAAGDAAKNVLGVAANDCITAANRDALQYPTGSAPMLNIGLDLTIPPATTTVYNRGEYDLTYTAAAVAHGAKICAAAAGKVRAWVSADGADAIIGYCTQVGGVSSSGGTGRSQLTL